MNLVHIHHRICTRRRRCCLLLCAATTAITLPAPELHAQEPRVRVPDAARLIAAFDSLVPGQMEQLHIPGAVLIVVKDGSVYASRGWGVTNVDTRAPVSPERSIFRVGSISKVFTAVAAMQQVDRGRLRLDADVNSYLKTWKVPATYPQPVRLEHLLSHTGGFDEITVGRKVFEPAKVVSLDTFLRDRLVRRRPPGVVSSYSTYGISLAGYLVESVTGMSLRSYFEREIFTPLGMTHASFGATRPEEKSDVVTGYSYGRSYDAEPWEYFHTSPASDVNATAADMAKFMIAQIDAEQHASPLMSDTMARLMHRVHARNDPRIPGVAYGYFEQRFNGYRALHHGGTMSGFKASMWLWPEQRMGLFLAYNREIDDLERRVLNRFAARALQPVLDSLDREETVWTKPRINADLRRFVGQYRQETWCHSCTGERGYQPSAVDVKLVNDSTLSFWGGQWAQVEPMLFRLMNGQLDFGQLYVAFRADSAGRITGLATGGPWWSERVGEMVAAPAPMPQGAVKVSARELQRYVGSYTLPPYGTVVVALDNDSLYAQVPGQSRLRLVPVSKSTFRVLELDSEVIFVRHWWQSRASGIVMKRTGRPDAMGKRGG